MKKILFALIALVFFAPCADAQLPKVGRVNKLIIDTLYSARIDSLTDGVRTESSRIDVLYNEIAIRVVDTVFNALEGRTYKNEGKIDVFSDLIDLRVDSVAYTAEGDTLFYYGSAIDIMQGQIALKVDVNGVVNAINIDTSGVKIDANKITLSGPALFYAMGGDSSDSFTSIVGGVVTTDYLNALRVNADSVDVGWLNANIVVADSVIANWINANTISADRISGDTLSGVVIDGVEIWGANIIGSNYYSTPTNGMFADGNLVAIDGETINFMSRTWSEAFGGGYELNSLGTITASDVENWNGKANAFSGYTGTLTVRLDDDSGLRLHFTNGVLTATSTP